MGTPLCSDMNCDMHRLWYSTAKLCSEHDLHLFAPESLYLQPALQHVSQPQPRALAAGVVG